MGQIFEYVLKKLTKETVAILQELLTAVTDRIESRRNKGICGFVRYLEGPNNYEQVVKSSLLSYIKKQELAKVATELFHNFFPITLLIRVQKILNMTSLKSPL